MSIIKEQLSKLGKDTIWYGNHNENERQVKLSAGSLSAIFDDGTLRYISTGKNELLRMIYPAVRDRDWLTVKPSAQEERIDQSANSFLITLKNNYRSSEIDLSATYIIEGRSDNTISFTMEASVIERSVKNRIGLCALHPAAGCSGSNCIIEHTDGTVEESAFPEEISPHQVFRNIRSLKWLSEGVHCTILFEGDIFETEDQRNWSDASFKTYSTPLSLPYPVTLEKNTRIWQKMTFRADRIPEIRDSVPDTVIVSISQDQQYKLPSIGICNSSRYFTMSKNDIKVLRALGFDHYRADLHLFSDGWKGYADQAINESSDLGCPLELALFIDDNATRQVRQFIDWYKEKRPFVASVLLLHRSQPSTPDQIASLIIPLIKGQLPEIRIATGTNANFAQINRNRPGNTGNDSICYSVHPQEHASDNLTLVENLAAQAYTVKSAYEFAGNKGIVVSPVTIQRRFNANVSLYEMPRAGNDFSFQTDSRLMSLFGACWTTGSIKYLCEAGADSITYYETAGERGIIQGESGSMWPDRFPAPAGMIFPVYYIFRYILGNKLFHPVRTISSHPLRVESFALSDGRQARLILVNFSKNEEIIRLDCCAGIFRNSILSSANFAKAVSDYRWKGSENQITINSLDDFKIEPFSVNFIEGWIKH